MKAVYVDDAYKVVVKDVEIPELSANEVLIKVKVAGICGSDIHTYKGLHPFRKPPVIIGHEIAGEVVKLGEAVTKLQLGDRVTVEPQTGCGTCEYCLTGKINYCANRGAPGIGNWYGAMAEYFTAPEQMVFKLPDSMSYEQGVLVEPFAVGVHAVRKAAIEVGDKVAVLGAGPIGLLAMAAAKAAGATTIMVTDVMDYALESAVQMGATHTLNIMNKPEWMAEAKGIIGGEFDKVLIAAGVPGIIDQSLVLLRKGGRIVTIAMFHGTQTFDIHNLQNQEKEIVGCMTYTREDTITAIDLIGAGALNEEAIISHRLSYEQAAEGFRLVDKKEDSSLKVLVTFE
ncbi:alcohol dehydrogenase catalytic domain-containing protein [Paenibacillus oenotherae]|uniref:Alcohol dehydrogenase catalytic domain-containing protein n=1 Tax=Paenibacillus oenotherae TaxID=1435645 RepID=A0ABS7D857_9BACL|nr:alcohol dehydrogenase catalytic domain-containing protein [Paenibacillus oenotherae]MBW7476107.1 alcohol dehydrogenase catalytic domain-containing protein [Paenibacillus oenotherae]